MLHRFKVADGTEYSGIYTGAIEQKSAEREHEDMIIKDWILNGIRWSNTRPVIPATWTHPWLTIRWVHVAFICTWHISVINFIIKLLTAQFMHRISHLFPDIYTPASHWASHSHNPTCTHFPNHSPKSSDFRQGTCHTDCYTGSLNQYALPGIHTLLRPVSNSLPCVQGLQGTTYLPALHVLCQMSWHAQEGISLIQYWSIYARAAPLSNQQNSVGQPE